MKKTALFVWLLFLTLSCTTIPENKTAVSSDSASFQVLDHKILDIINDSVFEVVIPKPKKDPLTYVHELPLDAIPYARRVDKFYSLGTAYAIAQDRFVTAAHVLNLDKNSQFQDIYIRDKQGKVYELDRIYKYSNHRDFVVFSVKNKRVHRTLKINFDPSMNEKVYTVGNALGQGVVVRAGLLTSETFEQANGKWKWLRFSAPASPGNSGGPLLDINGDIIGMITMKSENENLNFALPADEIRNFPEDLGKEYGKVTYSLANTSRTVTDIYDFEHKLPKEYHQFRQEVTKEYSRFVKGLFDRLLERNKSFFFPRGEGSLGLLYSVYNAVFPNLIAEGDDGNWNLYYPSETDDADLGENGYLEYGNMGDFTFLRMIKPDNVTLDQLYKDPKVYMDLVLKGVPLYRTVMDKKVRIKSLGDAVDNYQFTDNYQRPWLVNTWLLPYNDTKLVSFSLPVPGGVISIVKLAETDQIDNGYLWDLEVLSNFVYLSYYGSFSQWLEFLKEPSYLPALFKQIDFSYSPGEQALFQSSALSFKYGSSVFSITDDSDLKLELSFQTDGDKVVWDIGAVVVGEDWDNENYFAITKHFKPVKGLPESYLSQWKKLVDQVHPFNDEPYYDGGNTYISALYSRYGDVKERGDEQYDFLYTLTLGLEGRMDDDTMVKEKLNLIDKSVNISN